MITIDVDTGIASRQIRLERAAQLDRDRRLGIGVAEGGVAREGEAAVVAAEAVVAVPVAVVEGGAPWGWESGRQGLGGVGFHGA